MASKKKKKKDQNETPSCDQSIIVRKGEKPFTSGYRSQQKSYQVGPCV